MAYCNLLFKIEEGLAELPPEKRYEQRLKQGKPVLDTMSAWTNTRSAAPQVRYGQSPCLSQEGNGRANRGTAPKQHQSGSIE